MCGVYFGMCVWCVYACGVCGVCVLCMFETASHCSGQLYLRWVVILLLAVRVLG